VFLGLCVASTIFGVFQSGKSEFLQYRIQGKLCSFKVVLQALSIGLWFVAQAQFFGGSGQGVPATTPNDISTDTNISGECGHVISGCQSLSQSFGGTFFFTSLL